VPQGIITLMTRFGMDVVLAHPEGYDLVDDTLQVSRDFATASGGRFTVADSMGAAFADADIVYPKSWAPAWVMRERTRLLRSGEHAELAELEQQALANNAKHKDWEATDALMRGTRNGRALYMHCLPADVTGVSCAAGEVSRDVFERCRLDTYREASYKPFVIAALVIAARFRDPSAVLERCIQVAPLRRHG
jgi:ornithine carbamoyltransferase